MRTKMLGLLAAATALTLTAPASATTLVDTGVQTGNNGGGFTLSTTQYLAGEFTLGKASVLSSLMGYIASSSSNTIRVSLHANTNNLPGASLYSATFTSRTDGGDGAWQGVSSQNWAVAAGTYWLSFDNLTSSFGAYMPSSAPMPLAGYAYSGNQGTTWTNFAGNFGVRISDNVGSVPEPASWAMMILGVGIVGSAMRRRQKVRTNVSFA